MDEIYDILCEKLPPEIVLMILRRYMIQEVRRAKNNNDYQITLLLLGNNWNRTDALRILRGTFKFSDIKNFY